MKLAKKIMTAVPSSIKNNAAQIKRFKPIERIRMNSQIRYVDKADVINYPIDALQRFILEEYTYFNSFKKFWMPIMHPNKNTTKKHEPLKIFSEKTSKYAN